MKYHIQTTTSGVHVLDGKDTEIAFCDSLENAQRITDALNAQDDKPELFFIPASRAVSDAAEIGFIPDIVMHDKPVPVRQRDPDRVRLAAAALQAYIMASGSPGAANDVTLASWAQHTADTCLARLYATAKKEEQT